MTAANQTDKMLHCPALIAIKAISGKWKTRILWLMRSDELQFNDMRRRLSQVSAKVLTEHLRQLEEDGIIYHHSSNDGGTHVSLYGFTTYGSTLIPILDALGEWGITHEKHVNNSDKQ